MHLPNTLIIGAMKSGSSSLHNYLNQHPDVFMSQTKELNYFIEKLNYSKGMEWYRSQFPIKKQIIGESSVGYTKKHEYPEVSKNIYNTLGPKVKFIYIMRDPIERTVSHFIDSMLYKQLDDADYPEINESLIKANNIYTESSRYFYQIQAYLEYYDLSSFYFLSFEKLKKDPTVEMNKIFDFLNVRKLQQNELSFSIVNKTENKKLKSKMAKKLLNNAIAKSIKSKLPKGLRSYVVQQAFYQKIFNKPIVKDEYQLSDKTIDHLINYFEEDVNSMRMLSENGYSEWKAWAQSQTRKYA